MFPGFFAEEAVSTAELPLITNELVPSLCDRLSEEMLEHSFRLADPDRADNRTRAHELGCKFSGQGLPGGASAPAADGRGGCL